MHELELLRQALSGAGLDSTDAVIGRFETFADLLQEWNKEINLVSRKDPYRVIERHFLDSSGLAAVLDLEPGQRVMDLGSGGGFPCLPLAILCPEVSFVSVESKTKKTLFQKAVVEALALENVTVLAERAETLPENTGPFDWVVSRAVADLDQLVKWSRHLIRKPGGRMAVIKGPDLDEEMRRLSKRSTTWGIDHWEILPYRPFEKIRDKESRLVVIHW